VQVLGDELAVGDRRHGQARHEAVELAGTVQQLMAGAGRKALASATAISTETRIPNDAAASARAQPPEKCVASHVTT
jgi:hypothetical protein